MRIVSMDTELIRAQHAELSRFPNQVLACSIALFAIQALSDCFMLSDDHSAVHVFTPLSL